MRVKITTEKPRCGTCLFSTSVKTGEGFFCDKMANIVSKNDVCGKYQLAIEKVAEKRAHLRNFEKLELDKIEV